MNLDIGPARKISEDQARILETGNIMAKRSWKLYKQTLDESHANRAEWWRLMAEKAIEREES